MRAELPYEVIFYTIPSGECPLDEFLDNLPVKVRAKLEKWLELLEEEGPGLPRPYADVLRDKIRELRVKYGHAQYRVLYFFLAKKIVLTHGFMKKTDKVPEAEINLAVKYMKDFCGRVEAGEIEL